MKKETVKELLKKVTQKLKISKKEAVPAVMAMMALAAIIGLTVHAYQSELFENSSAITAEKIADAEKEEPEGGNQTEVKAKGTDKKSAESAGTTAVPVKEKGAADDKKAQGESKKTADTGKEKTESTAKSDENAAAQMGSSEKGSSKSEAGNSQKTKKQTPAAETTPEPTAAYAAEEQSAVPASVQQFISQQPASVQESTQESQPAAAPQPAAQPVQPEATPAPEPVHEHTWVPITVSIHHDAVTHTVHHDAVTQTVHHDAVTHEEPVYEFRTICNTCGADITGHIPDHIGSVCLGSYGVQQVQTGVNVVTDQEAYDEEVAVQDAWDETVTDQAAYDDVVTTGYRCSTCGMTRQ